MKKATTTFFICFAFLFSFGQGKKTSKNSLKLPDAVLKQVSYIPSKTFTSLSYNGNDSASTYRSRISTVKGFYISKTEVTNREYREFVHYIRDSIAHGLLSHLTSGNAIDWTQAIDWKDKRLDGMMVSPGDNFGRREIDPGKIVYSIDFFGQEERVCVYPDTLVWIRDFKFSYNEPLVKKYFAHSEYDQYPVVGIHIKQAMAFCQWKTGQLRQSLKNSDPAIEIQVALPTNAEWESAAFDIKDSLHVETRNKKYHYNFGNIIDANRITIKDYKDDGYVYSAPVKSYKAGWYDLYDMKGNVAEWTRTSMEEVMNAELRPGRQKSFFTAKGGGWNSTPFYLQAGACQFLSADAVHSYVGFRYVVHTGK